MSYRVIYYTYFIDYIIFGYIYIYLYTSLVYIDCALSLDDAWSKVKDDCCVFLTACYQSTSFHIFYRFVWPMYDDWIQCFRNPLQRQSSPAEFVHLIHYRCEGFSNKPKLGFVWSDVLQIVPWENMFFFPSIKQAGFDHLSFSLLVCGSGSHQAIITPVSILTSTF